jgi:hypothetical protein
VAGRAEAVAGTTHLPMLNAYVVALAPSLLVMMLAIAPRIAQERGSADGGKDDLHDLRARWDVYVIPPRMSYWRAATDLLADAQMFVEMILREIADFEKRGGGGRGIKFAPSCKGGSDRSLY